MQSTNRVGLEGLAETCATMTIPSTILLSQTATEGAGTRQTHDGKSITPTTPESIDESPHNETECGLSIGKGQFVVGWSLNARTTCCPASTRTPAKRAPVRGHEDWCPSDVESRAVRVARKLESLPCRDAWAAALLWIGATTEKEHPTGGATKADSHRSR